MRQGLIILQTNINIKTPATYTGWYMWVQFYTLRESVAQQKNLEK